MKAPTIEIAEAFHDSNALFYWFAYGVLSKKPVPLKYNC